MASTKRNSGVFVLLLIMAMATMLVALPVLAQETAEPSDDKEGTRPGDSIPYDEMFPPEDRTKQVSFDPPGNFSVDSSTCTSVSLSWDPVFLATQYRLTYTDTPESTDPWTV